MHEAESKGSMKKAFPQCRFSLVTYFRFFMGLKIKQDEPPPSAGSWGCVQGGFGLNADAAFPSRSDLKDLSPASHCVFSTKGWILRLGSKKQRCLSLPPCSHLHYGRVRCQEQLSRTSFVLPKSRSSLMEQSLLTAVTWLSSGMCRGF